MSNIKRKYSVDDLLYLVRRLRDPEDGCPWDLEQTPKTIINYSIEEVYELADVIENDRENTQAFKDELGDVLFQVIFLSQLAKDAGDFEFEDVANHLCEKMVRRHPHVFSNGELYSDKNNKMGPSGVSNGITTTEVKQSWEKIKQQERQAKVKQDIFSGVPVQLPALVRASKLQKRAANIGLDWPDIQGVRDKLAEELGELDTALTQLQHQNSAKKQLQQELDVLSQVAEELGDVLFSVVNLGRHLQLNSEQVLRASNDKFTKRVTRVQEMIQESARLSDTQQELSDEALDVLWQKSKQEHSQ